MLFSYTAPLCDSQAQEVIEKALQSSSLDIRNVVSVITGLMGSGKTWFLSRLFNQVPPNLYMSTGIVEQSVRGVMNHTGSISLSCWLLFSSRNMLEFVAHHFRENSSYIGDECVSGAANTDPSPHKINESSTSVMITDISNSTAISTASTSTTSQSMVSLVKSPCSSLDSSELELIHVIDTGGQPEFMESMQCLIYKCHLAVLVLNLMHEIDGYPSIDYHENGRKYTQNRSSHYTNRQLIQMLASTLQAKRFSSSNGSFQLLVIATHQDCLHWWQRNGRIQEFDRALKDILMPACEDELICYSANQILFDLNLKHPNKNDLAKLDLIRSKISECSIGEIVKTPGSFLVFEQELMEFAENVVNRYILSLEECIQVGAKLKMNAQIVRAALIFFHRQLTLLYFHHVLPNVIFMKPQIPLDFVNAIVKFRYMVGAGEVFGISVKMVKYLRDGIITKEILGHPLLSKCFIPHLYQPSDAIDLLCHTFSLAPFQRETVSCLSPSKLPEYLMMALMPILPKEEMQKYLPSSAKIAPLVIQFSKNCVPVSCFSRAISCLMTLYNWKLIRSVDNNSPLCLAHNMVSLFDPDTPGQITLIDKGHSIEVHLVVCTGASVIEISKICCQVKESVFTAIKQVFERLNLTGIEIEPAFMCSCNNTLQHQACPFIFNSKWLLRCSQKPNYTVLAPESCTTWIATSSKNTISQPTLPKLLQLKLHEKIATKFRVFGTFLLCDEDGSLVEAIEHYCRGDCESIVCRILSNWISGRGRPVTWEALADTLQLCMSSKLAEEVKKQGL